VVAVAAAAGGATVGVGGATVGVAAAEHAAAMAVPIAPATLSLRNSRRLVSLEPFMLAVTSDLMASHRAPPLPQTAERGNTNTRRWSGAKGSSRYTVAPSDLWHVTIH